MELYRLITIPIIISGVIFVVLPRGEYFQSFNDLILYLTIDIGVFIGCIVWFNQQLLKGNRTKTSQGINHSFQAILNRSGIDFKSDSKKTYYIKVLGSWFIIATYLGFKYKSISDAYFLNKAAKKESKWQSDLLIESYKSDDSFFQLRGYHFNWEIFIISFIIMIAIAYIIRNTIYYERIKNYIDSIKR